jgi:hypothetical protein
MFAFSGIPQPLEGARPGGQDGGEAGAGNPDTCNASEDGRWKHNAHTLDQEDNRRGGTLHASAVPHFAAGGAALQSVLPGQTPPCAVHGHLRPKTWIQLIACHGSPKTCC